MTLDQVIARFDNPQRSGRGASRVAALLTKIKKLLKHIRSRRREDPTQMSAGCATKTIVDAANLTWRDLGRNENRGPSKDDPVTARYIYVGEGRKPLYRACRTRPKKFFQERFDVVSGRFIPGMNGTRRVLYRLPEILNSEIVYIAEG
jgi:hypothetical protein